jgi:hypothetical protein
MYRTLVWISMCGLLWSACDDVIPQATLEQATLEDWSVSSVDASLETMNEISDMGGVLSDIDVDQNLADEFDMLLPVRQMSRFEISVSPAREVYRIGQQLNLKWNIYDIFGDEIQFDTMSDIEKELLQAHISWSSNTVVDMTIEGHQAELTWIENAVAQVEICIQEQCKTRDFWIDQALTNLVITYPAQGAMLSLESEGVEINNELTSPVQIPIQGSIQSVLLEYIDVNVNGMSAMVDEEGQFIARITPTWGLNHIKIEVLNRIDTTRTVHYIDFLWSPTYYPVQDQSCEVAEALYIQIDQSLLDQGPYPQLAEVIEQVDPQGIRLDIEGLAQLIEVIFAVIDTSSLIDTSTLFNNDNSNVDPSTFAISEISLGMTDVDFFITEEGLELILSLPQVSLQTEGVVDFNGVSLSLEGSINIALRSSIEFVFKIEDLFIVDIGASNIVIESLTADFESDGVEALINAVSDQLLESIEDQFIQVIDQTLREQLGGFLRDALQGLFGDLRDTTIEVPNPLQEDEPKILNFSLFPTHFQNISQQWARFALQLSLSHNTSLELPLNDLGVIKADAPLYNPMQGRGFIAELSLDLLNAIFHEIWRTGILNTTIPMPADVSNLVYAASIESLLPPIIVPHPLPSSDPLLLQLGALIIDLQLTQEAAADRYLLTLQSGLRLGLDQGAFAFDLAEIPEVTVHLLQNNSGQALNASLLEVIIVNSLWSELRSSLTGGINFALSTFEINADALSQFSDQVQSLSISTQFDPSFVLRESALVAHGVLSMVLQLIPAQP